MRPSRALMVRCRSGNRRSVLYAPEKQAKRLKLNFVICCGFSASG